MLEEYVYNIVCCSTATEGRPRASSPRDPPKDMMESFLITVPKTGAPPGSVINVKVPKTGEVLEVALPADSLPLSTLQVPMPFSEVTGPISATLFAPPPEVEASQGSNPGRAGCWRL